MKRIILFILILSSIGCVKKKEIVMEEYPENLLYEEGHVLIYLGMKNDKHYVINALGSILKVVEEELDSSYHLGKIQKLVLIN